MRLAAITLGAITGCALALSLASAAGAADAATNVARERTLSILESIAPSGGPPLRTWVNSGLEREIEIDEPVVFHFESQADGYLTAIYLDSHGAATVLYPTTDPKAGRLAAGIERRFPAPESGMGDLTAQLPLGTETVFALWTREPLTLRDLGAPDSTQGLLVVDASEAPDLANRLAAHVAKLPGGSASISRFDQTVLARAEQGTQYTSRGIVSFFTERHRAIQRPKLDLNIKFEFGSDQLTDAARRDLDEVGKALGDSRLESKRFVMAGHTDDVGEAAYNEELSKRRARAARDYLVKNHGIDAARLDSTGYGESDPVVLGTSEALRAQNRRVVLEMLR